MGVLVINCGSSSVKFALFSASNPHPVAHGIVERLLGPHASGELRLPDGTTLPLSVAEPGDHQAGLRAALDTLRAQPGLESVEAIGHRIVHGGQDFAAPTRITPEVLATIRGLASLAPVHAIPNALGIEAATALFPDVPQVAVFDTAFHQSIEPRVYRYAIPEELYQDYGIRRYGFHGTSHAWVAARAVEQLGLPQDQHRLLTAHLGNGCSATAVLHGHSADTSMGLTPLEGLVMGTRSGNVDPNLHLFLHQQTGMSLEEITALLNQKSGLAGLAGVTDMRQIAEKDAQGDPSAHLAIEVFTFRLARELAGLCAALGGPPDALVFTGGIGENSARIRRDTVAQLGALGFKLHPAANDIHGRESAGCISPPGTAPAVLVVPTNEEFAIASATLQLIGLA
ncbi:acetate kinase [Haloferula luteola]|uniref:Acetate kinase n=1 Tax=Haloferula luteola TaxID=595692 RepID=A0A840VER5_9BACT|nr:acetate kinase [Haloferula luteola]MBB5352340.1 acetate kinase [Haloferula luteola]